MVVEVDLKILHHLPLVLISQEDLGVVELVERLLKVSIKEEQAILLRSVHLKGNPVEMVLKEQHHQRVNQELEVVAVQVGLEILHQLVVYLEKVEALDNML